MIYFVGAGSGAPDLITVRGQRLLQTAGLVIYAGSLVNPELLALCPTRCVCMNSAAMTLAEIVSAMAESDCEVVVRLHTGDPCLFGAVREQMDALQARSIPFENVPGVSSFCAAAAALHAEYTLPGVSQTVIISRMAGRTPVPERESIRSLAAHQATMVLFLSASMLDALCGELIAGGYPADTPSALVYKASWPEETVIRGTLASLPELGAAYTKTALVVVGGCLGDDYQLSRLYDASFSHAYREAKE